MNKPVDDLEAVKTLVETLEPFNAEDRERVMRWAREKLGMAGAGPAAIAIQAQSARSGGSPRDDAGGRSGKDIKSFLNEKSPKSDRQLAAAVAYYYAFEVPSGERKESIGSQDLVDACRLAGRRRPTNAGQTLRNAAHAGYLDKAPEAGRYTLNSVGENLVAMVLPGGAGEPSQVKRKRKGKGVRSKKGK